MKGHVPFKGGINENFWKFVGIFQQNFLHKNHMAKKAGTCVEAMSGSVDSSFSNLDARG